jgi:zinc/manganese transport system substrate-binding protein
MRTILANGHRMLAVVLTTSLLSACGGPTTADTRPLVVVTTTILGDVVTNLAGGSARVHVLMPPGADPHEYAASASDVALIRGADLVIANGLSLEFGLADTLDSLPESVPVLAVGDMVDPRHFVGGAPDPHFWFDPMRMSDAVEIIRAALDAAAPGQADAIDIAASAYQAELAGLDAEVDALVSVVPPDRRLLVANHAFLGYFAERYGFEVVGSVISGGSTVERSGGAGRHHRAARRPRRVRRGERADNAGGHARRGGGRPSRGDPAQRRPPRGRLLCRSDTERRSPHRECAEIASACTG